MNIKAIKEWIERNEPQGHTKLSAALEVNPVTLARWLRTGYATTKVLHRIAEITGIPVTELIKQSKPEPKSKKKSA